MQINSINSSNNINFSAYMRQPHVRFLESVNPHNAEKILENMGVSADFGDSKLAAGLSLYAVRAFRALNLKLPSQLIVHNINAGKNIEKQWLESYWSTQKTLGRKKIKKFAVGFSKKYFSYTPQEFEQNCSLSDDDMKSCHFLELIFHEFMHQNLFRKLQKQVNKQHASPSVMLKKLDKISLEPFKDEIVEKFGTYAATDAFELHAVYWAKEIADSLNGSLLPKYNPLKNPQIKLSKELRIFMNKITRGDFKGAKKYVDSLEAAKK